MKMKIHSSALSFILLAGLMSTGGCYNKGSYTGVPYSDSVYFSGPQAIPGKLQCEYYDSGGEGIAFHDTDTINSGSGRLNPEDGSYLHEFRKNEAVDISYTKFRDPPIDNSEYNLVVPGKDQFYVGWTSPGEWTKYSVIVRKTGTYELGLMYTANQDGRISVSVNDEDVTGELAVQSTFNAADTIPWRQWHHWNYLDRIARIYLKKGFQTITIHTVDIGQMNYDYLNFTLSE